MGTTPVNRISEGDLYKVLEAFGKRFEIKYGYYEDFERSDQDPIPIYPDFQSNPEYTADGSPFVTQMQDMCRHAVFKASGLWDECCSNCIH